MTDAIVVILSGNKATVYLYASVPLDDFKLAWSDIDIYIDNSSWVLL